jgi:arabinofuranan 3-O-arabinosyltransferase
MATLLIRAADTTGGTSSDVADAGRGPEGDRRLPLAERVQWTTVCLGFLALTLSQQPGRIVADTKLDLTIDPWGWLGRALQLWEPEGFAGQVQNQAYGYLFPMGPFFGVGQSLGVPGWMVQRLWMALLLSVAFVGVSVLARQLRIGTPGSRLIGALAYALAPGCSWASARPRSRCCRWHWRRGCWSRWSPGPRAVLPGGSRRCRGWRSSASAV